MKVKQLRARYLVLALCGVIASEALWAIPGVGLFASTELLHGGARVVLFLLFGVLLLLSPLANISGGRSNLKVGIEAALFGLILAFLVRVIFDSQLLARSDALWVLLLSTLSLLAFGRAVAKFVIRIFLRFVSPPTVASFISGFCAVSGDRSAGYKLGFFVGRVVRPIQGQPVALSTQTLRRCQGATDLASRRLLRKIRTRKASKAALHASSSTLLDAWRAEARVSRCFAPFFEDEYLSGALWLRRFDEVWCCLLESEWQGKENLDVPFSAQALEILIDEIADVQAKEPPPWCSQKFLQKGRAVSGEEWRELNQAVKRNDASGDSSLVSGFWRSIVAEKFIRNGFPAWALGCLEETNEGHWLRSQDILRHRALVCLEVGLSVGISEEDSFALGKEASRIGAVGSAGISPKKSKQWGSRRGGKSKLPMWDFGAGPGVVMALAGLTAAVLVWVWSDSNVRGEAWPTFSDIHRASDYQESHLTAAAKGGSSDSILIGDADGRVHELSTRNFRMTTDIGLTGNVLPITQLAASDGGGNAFALVGDSDTQGLFARRGGRGWDAILPTNSIPWFDEESILDVELMKSEWLFATKRGVVRYDVSSRLLKGYKFDEIADAEKARWQGAGKLLILRQGHLEELVMREDEAPLLSQLPDPGANPVVDIADGGWVLCEAGDAFRRIDNQWERIMGGTQFPGRRVFKDGWTQASEAAGIIWSVMPEEGASKWVVSSRSLSENFWEQAEASDLTLQPPPMIHPDGKSIRIALNGGGFLDVSLTDTVLESSISEMRDKILSWDSTSTHHLILSVDSLGVKRLRMSDWEETGDIVANVRGLLRLQATVVTEKEWAAVTVGPTGQDAFFINHSGDAYLYDFELGGATGLRRKIIGTGFSCTGATFLAEESAFIALSEDGSIWKTVFPEGSPELLYGVKKKPDLSSGVSFVFQWLDGLDIWTHAGSQWHFNPQTGWEAIQAPSEAVQLPVLADNQWFILGAGGSVYERVSAGWEKTERLNLKIDRLVASSRSLLARGTDGAWMRYQPSEMRVTPLLAGSPSGRDKPVMPLEEIVGVDDWGLLIADQAGVLSYEYETRKWRRLASVDTVENNPGLDWMATTDSAGTALFFCKAVQTFYLMDYSKGPPQVALTEENIQQVSLGGNGEVAFIKLDGSAVVQHGTARSNVSPPANNLSLDSYSTAVVCRGQPVFLSEGRVFWRREEGLLFSELLGPWGASKVVSLAAEGTALAVLDNRGDLWIAWDFMAFEEVPYKGVMGVVINQGALIFSNAAGAVYLQQKGKSMRLLAGGKGDFTFSGVRAAIANNAEVFLLTDEGVLFRDPKKRRLQRANGDKDGSELKEVQEVSGRSFALGGGHASELLWRSGSMRVLPFEQRGILDLFPGENGDVLALLSSSNRISSYSSTGELETLWPKQQVSQLGPIRYAMEMDTGALLFDGSGRVAIYQAADHAVIDIGSLRGKPRGVYQQGETFLALVEIGAGNVRMKRIRVRGEKMSIEMTGPPTIWATRRHDGVLYAVGGDYSCWAWNKKGEEELLRSAPVAKRVDEEILGVLTSRSDIHLLTSGGKHFEYEPASGKSRFLSNDVRRLLLHDGLVVEEVASGLRVGNSLFKADTVRGNGKVIAYQRGSELGLLGSTAISASFASAKYPGSKPVSSGNSSSGNLVVMDDRGDLFTYSASLARWERYGAKASRSDWRSLIFLEGVPAFAWKPGHLIELTTGRTFTCMFPPVEIGDDVFFITKEQQLMKGGKGSVLLVRDWASKIADTHAGGRRVDLAQGTIIEGANNQLLAWDGNSFRTVSPSVGRTVDFLLSGEAGANAWVVFADGAVALLDQLRVQAFGEPVRSPSWRFLGVRGAVAYSFDPELQEVYSLGDGRGWKLDFQYGVSHLQDIPWQSQWLAQDGISIGFDLNKKWWLRVDQSPMGSWQEVDVAMDIYKYGLRVVRIPGIANVVFVSFSEGGTFAPTYSSGLAGGAGDYLDSIKINNGSLEQGAELEISLCEEGVFIGSPSGNYVVPYGEKVAHQSPAMPLLESSKIPFEVASDSLQQLPGDTGVVFWDMRAGRPLSKIGVRIGTSSGGELAVQTEDGRWSSLSSPKEDIAGDGVELPVAPPRWVESGGPFALSNFGGYSYKDEDVEITLGSLTPSLPFDSDRIQSYIPIAEGGSILVEDRNARLWVWSAGARRPLRTIPSNPSGGRFSFNSSGFPLFSAKGSGYAVNQHGAVVSDQHRGSLYFKQDSPGSESFLSWEKSQGRPFNFLAKDTQGIDRSTHFNGIGFDFDLPNRVGVTERGELVGLCSNGVGRELVSGRLSSGRALPEEKEVLQVDLDSGGLVRKTPNESFSLFLNKPETEGKLLFERSSSGQFKVDQPVRADGDGKDMALLVDQGTNGALIIQGLGRRDGERVALSLPDNNGVAGLIPHIGEEGIWLKSEWRCWFLQGETWSERPIEQFPLLHQPSSFLEMASEEAVWSFDSVSDRFHLGSDPVHLDYNRGAFSCDDLIHVVSESTVASENGNILILGKDGWRISPRARIDFPSLWGEAVHVPDVFAGVPAAGWAVEKKPSSDGSPLIQIADGGGSIPFSIRGGKLPFEIFKGIHAMDSKVLGITEVGTRILPKGRNSTELNLISGASEFKWRPQTSLPILGRSSNGTFLLFDEAQWKNAPVGVRNSWLEWNRLHLGNTDELEWQRKGAAGIVLSHTRTGMQLALSELGFLADQVDFLAADEGLLQIDASGQLWESSSYKSGINALTPSEKLERPSIAEQIRFPDGELGYLIRSKDQQIALSVSAMRRGIERGEAAALRSAVGFQGAAVPGFVAATLGVKAAEIQWRNPGGIIRNLHVTEDGFDFEKVLSVAGFVENSFVGWFQGGVLTRSNTGALLDVLPIQMEASPGVVYESGQTVFLRLNGEEHELAWDGELLLRKPHGSPLNAPLFERSIWRVERSFAGESAPFHLASTLKGVGAEELQPCAIVNGALGVHSTDNAWFSTGQRIITSSKRGISQGTPGERGGLHEERFSRQLAAMKGDPGRSLTSEVALRFDVRGHYDWWTFSEANGWEIDDSTRFQLLSEGTSLDNNWRWKGGGFAGDFTLEYQVKSEDEQLSFKPVVDLEGGLDVDWCTGITSFEGEPLLISKSTLVRPSESRPMEGFLVLPFPLRGRVKMGSVGDGISIVPLDREERASSMFVARNDGYLSIQPASEKQVNNQGVILDDSLVGKMWRTSAGLNFERRGSLTPQSPLKPASILRGGKFTFDRAVAIRAVGESVSVLTESSLELLSLDTMELSLVASWENAAKERDLAIEGKTAIVNQPSGAALGIDLTSFESKPWSGQFPVKKQAVLLGSGELQVSSIALSIDNEPIEIPAGALFTTWSHGRLWGVYHDGLRFLSTQDRWLKKVTNLE